eukprot:TRINITY_DN987_c2_g1_i1.p1 TRINITY_DN987_c2_g1~~TRINITY_DN987_c2_g1_i1.p1  ORF type:complete len:211 (+),score=25.54 TRINITY_DN987_c2_g1_i1:150-782(+)
MSGRHEDANPVDQTQDLLPTPPQGESEPSRKRAKTSEEDAQEPPKKRPPATLCAYAVQCSTCQKWRKVPELEIYEEIRARSAKEEFTCEQATQWQQDPPVTCETPADLEPDNTMIWAIDRPGIPQPPKGWQRTIQVRSSEGSKQFADVYYKAPNGGKVLRSIKDVEKFLASNPALGKDIGVDTSFFSFSSPRPDATRFPQLAAEGQMKAS